VTNPEIYIQFSTHAAEAAGGLDALFAEAQHGRRHVRLLEAATFIPEI
jgi:hypothetical protein